MERLEMKRNFYTHKTINGIKKTVHRHVMQEHLGRELESHEHVYHVNGDPKDNRIENLIMITKKYGRK
jgi:HNH endonuclease